MVAVEVKNSYFRLSKINIHLYWLLIQILHQLYNVFFKLSIMGNLNHFIKYYSNYYFLNKYHSNYYYSLYLILMFLKYVFLIKVHIHHIRANSKMQNQTKYFKNGLVLFNLDCLLFD